MSANCVLKGCLFFTCLFIGTPLLVELIILPYIAYTIYKDEVLHRNIGVVLGVCYWFLFTCHFLILRSTYMLKPKPSVKHKSIDDLTDMDLIFQCEIQDIPKRRTNLSRFVHKSFDFVKFRPVYGFMLLVGIVFLSLYLTIQLSIETVEKDLYSVSSELFLPGFTLIVIPLFLANSGAYVKDEEHSLDSYRPFQEFVEVPQTVMVGKALADMVLTAYQNIVRTLSFLIWIISSSFLLLYVYQMTDDKEMLNKYEERLQIFKNVPVRYHVAIMFGAIILSGISLLANMIRCSWSKAKLNIFAIIEKNWQRNLRAIEYLLPFQDGEINGLEDLEAALVAKRKQKLEDGEERAFSYIEMPLWQTRKPFVGRPLKKSTAKNSELQKETPVDESSQSSEESRQKKAEETVVNESVEQSTLTSEAELEQNSELQQTIVDESSSVSKEPRPEETADGSVMDESVEKTRTKTEQNSEQGTVVNESSSASEEPRREQIAVGPVMDESTEKTRVKIEQKSQLQQGTVDKNICPTSKETGREGIVEKSVMAGLVVKTEADLKQNTEVPKTLLNGNYCPIQGPTKENSERAKSSESNEQSPGTEKVKS